jgi:hypothetical protein
MSASFAAQPDALGRFGPYGGRYVPETLMDALRQLTEVYESARKSPEFQRDFHHYLRTYVDPPFSGRPFAYSFKAFNCSSNFLILAWETRRPLNRRRKLQRNRYPETWPGKRFSLYGGNLIQIRRSPAPAYLLTPTGPGTRRSNQRNNHQRMRRRFSMRPARLSGQRTNPARRCVGVSTAPLPAAAVSILST